MLDIRDTCEMKKYHRHELSCMTVFADGCGPCPYYDLLAEKRLREKKENEATDSSTG